ncbi:MAG: T9SS type A sorting domain-containing protein [Chitinophagales bacterium]|nr:T9SS type A sorting domain-containing protein [Chitinophagales bacterium]
MNAKTILTLLFLFVAHIAYSQQTWTYDYDVNGNRTAVAYAVSCRMAQTPPPDLSEPDKKDLMSKLQPVQELMLYPNPATTGILVSLPTDMVGGTVTLYNETGQMVCDGITLSMEQTMVNIADLAPGTYILQYRGTKEQIYTKKFVKL